VNQKAILFLKFSFKLVIKTTEMKITRILCLAFLLSFCQFSLQAQEIKQEKGFSPQIGSVVSMLEDLKRKVTNSVPMIQFGISLNLLVVRQEQNYQENQLNIIWIFGMK
jgi:hypothetical protein